jgi:twitching motility protein PilT
MARIDRYFEQLRAAGASDLHLSSGKAPLIRSSGHVAPMANETELSDRALRDLLKEIASQPQWERFERDHDLDFAITIPNVARFRANYFEQEHGMGAVFRMIPEEIIPIDKLGLPEVVHGLADLESGLVLVTGPTGSGKSTTLAAIVDLINRKHLKHMVTIEDPVEFVHGNKRSILSHREVGTHSNDFGSALKAALRQDADVILVGEMRDLETISLALEAASMGVLVFGTLHTNSAAKTIDRIIDSFPTDKQDQARGSLADSLIAVVAQILVRRKEGGRVGVHEILVRTPGLGGAIREGNTAMINSIIGAGRGQGMQTMDNALMELVRTNVLDGHEAYLKAADKKLFQQWAEAGAH